MEENFHNIHLTERGRLFRFEIVRGTQKLKIIIYSREGNKTNKQKIQIMKKEDCAKMESLGFGERYKYRFRCEPETNIPMNGGSAPVEPTSIEIL